MKMTRFFIQRPLLFWSLMVAILVAGVLSFIQMPKLEDPAISLKQAMVVVPWPGASAHDMELKVAQKDQNRVSEWFGDVYRRISDDGIES